MNQEYKYSLSYSNANKKFGDGDEVFVNIRGDDFEEIYKEMTTKLKKKALLLLKPAPSEGNTQPF